jgi:hypothetical protein
MTLAELYASSGSSSKYGIKSCASLGQAHWFAFNAEFDPKTGEALPQALSAFLAKITRTDTSSVKHDRLWRITEHARPSVERLLHSLNESPRREHALMPVHAVRDLDANSFIKLSTRPGRNIREKLAGKPYLQAVRRFQSVNLPENRLLKAFVIRLSELLELRRDCLGEDEDELFSIIHYWLRSEEAQAIARWDNLPPNNTLLSHRDYRRIWDSWRWIQSLDEDIAHDLANFESRAEIMREWQYLGEVYLAGGQQFADQPVLFRYNSFSVRPWSAPIQMKEVKRKVARSQGISEILEPACVDLVNPRPRYATTSQPYGALPDTYLWQQWHDGRETFDLGLFRSDAAFLHADTTAVASSDLFFVGEQSNDLMQRAARSFASRLRETFKNDSLIWLVPDSINDFEIEILRRNLNSRFARAEPLPRSVAAVFEQVEYSGIKREGYTVVVVDSIGGRNCATKLITKFDEELLKRLPETKGIYWERCPSVTLSISDQRAEPHADPQRFDLLTLDSKGNWHDSGSAKNHQPISPKALKEDPRIGPFDLLIELKKSPVAGGARLHSLQLQAGNIPLWRDKMPELSIEAKINGRSQRFYLVSRETPPVKPIRGQPISIQVAKNFHLPFDRPFYRFRLFQGENADELGFSARLDSLDFPFEKDPDPGIIGIECKLSLSFEYGADEPYKLIFIPLNKNFLPIRATWKRAEEGIITDAPSPEYPKPMTWDDLRRVPKPNGKETSDLFEWMGSAVNNLHCILFNVSSNRTIGVISSYWRKDKNGSEFTFASCNKAEGGVFIHENNFLDGFYYDDFEQGDEVSFDLQERGGKFYGYRVAEADYKEDLKLREFEFNDTIDIVSMIRKSLYFPFIQVWRDGRSIDDKEFPADYKESIEKRFIYLAALLTTSGIPQQIKKEILFLLSCLHKQAPEECVEIISEKVSNGNISDPRTVGFALGDVSMAWQLHIFRNLAANSNSSEIRVFSHAIWREKHFIEAFTISELHATLDALMQRMKNISLDKHQDGTIGIVCWPLELLLGLLRARASNIPEIRMLLQPHQKITKEFAKQVERVTEIVAKSNIELFSRVQINVNKPVGDRTPDLLYALRLYLTGDDGANAIHIISISDSDDG